MISDIFVKEKQIFIVVCGSGHFLVLMLCPLTRVVDALGFHPICRVVSGVVK